jgi:hypothetical protein
MRRWRTVRAKNSRIPGPTRDHLEVSRFSANRSPEGDNAPSGSTWDVPANPVAAGHTPPYATKLWGQLRPGMLVPPGSYEPPGSLTLGGAVDNPDRELQAQQNAAPEHGSDDPVALLRTLAAEQRQPGTDKGCRQAKDQRQRVSGGGRAGGGRRLPNAQRQLDPDDLCRAGRPGPLATPTPPVRQRMEGWPLPGRAA